MASSRRSLYEQRPSWPNPHVSEVCVQFKHKLCRELQVHWHAMPMVAGKVSTSHADVLPHFLFGLLLAASLRGSVFVLQSFIGRLAEANGRGAVACLGGKLMFAYSYTQRFTICFFQVRMQRKYPRLGFVNVSVTMVGSNMICMYYINEGFTVTPADLSL